MKAETFLRLSVLLSGLILPLEAHAFYNPSTGRWLNRDPIEERGGLNPYALVANTPVQNFDLVGLCGKCCECAVAIDIVDVSYAEDIVFGIGHQFFARIFLEYHPAEMEGSVKFKWEEKSNRPPKDMIEQGDKPNHWYDTMEICPDCDGNDKWKNRSKKCDPPVGRIVEIFDWPRIGSSNPKRVLQFRLTAENPKDCGCEKDKVSVTAIQTLDPAASPKGKFEVPDPSQ